MTYHTDLRDRRPDRDGFGAIRTAANEDFFILALGITMEGEKEVLGLWIAQTEGAKFWLQVVTELGKSRTEGYLDRLRGRSERIS